MKMVSCKAPGLEGPDDMHLTKYILQETEVTHRYVYISTKEKTYIIIYQHDLRKKRQSLQQQKMLEKRNKKMLRVAW